MRRAIFCALAMLSGCSSRDQVALHYVLVGINPQDVVRVETIINVDPKDARLFYADQSYREVATGVGYEVRDVDQSGKREVQITHDSTIGYVFGPKFTFTLLPPVGESAPPLVLTARAVSVSDPIGGTMPIAVTFGGNRGVDVPIMDQRCAGKTICAADQQCCSDGCARTLDDLANCGACGHACQTSESCSGGQCRCGGGSACPTGESCCGNGCVDTKIDPFNCGACGKACAAGETCAGGACHCLGLSACAANQACCAVSGCSSTGCACGGGSVCPTIDTCCSSPSPHCANTKTSNADCGMCGHACPAGLTCANGSCACKGQICVAGDKCCSTGCANTANDPRNCGSCGHACNLGEICNNGNCACGTGPACTGGKTCCGNACVDTRSDSGNCGGCGILCRPGEVCNLSMCSCAGGRACVGNETCCSSTPAPPGGNGCFDTSNNATHCGSCATPCMQQQSCSMGMCVASSCGTCTNGNTCVGASCQCNGGPACMGTQTCCPGIGCVDLSSATGHCGSCTKACNTGDYCCSGNCVHPNDNDCTGCGMACGALGRCCICSATMAPYCSLDVCVCAVPPQ